MQMKLTPKERVQAYIRDWHEAWKECGSGQVPSGDFEFFERWRKALHAKVGHHVIVAERVVDGLSSYGTPPEHDPAVETVRKETEHATTVRIETVVTDFGGNYFEYELLIEQGEWRINKVTKFFHDEGEMAFSSSALEQLLAASSLDADLPALPPGDSPNCDLLFHDGVTLSVEDWWNSWPGSLSTIKTYQITVKKVGILSLPSGKIVVRDFGYWLEDARPLARSVHPGDYPVEICEADGTCAAVRIVFHPNAKGPFTFHPALDVDDSDRGRGTIGVDGGRAAICDAEAFLRRTKREHERDGIELISKLSEQTYPNSVFLNLCGSIKPNAVDFRSGHGDGSYPCYWVVDTAGQTIALVLDFLVVAQFLKRTMKKPWSRELSGVIFEHSTAESKMVTVSVDRVSESISVMGDLELIRWLDQEGKWIADTNGLGYSSSGDERRWRISFSQLDAAAAWFEVVSRAGYRNGGQPKGEVC